MSRTFTCFVCSFLVTGELLNLELRFPDRPLPSELRARAVNAFRRAEESLVDRSVSIAFDVTVMFVFDAVLRRWCVMTNADIVAGAQIYAQPRLSNSIMRTLCDAADSVDAQLIPPPQLEDAHSRAPPGAAHRGAASRSQLVLSPTAVAASAPAPAPAGGVVRPDDEASAPPSPRQAPPAAAAARAESSPLSAIARPPPPPPPPPHEELRADLALAQSWDDACRMLFVALDDDCDGVVSIPEVPLTLQRIAAGTPALAGHLPSAFHQDGDSWRQSPEVVDVDGFVAFCNSEGNAEIVAGLLSFIHTCRKIAAEQASLRTFEAVRSHAHAANYY
jgi:hypothetical protein